MKILELLIWFDLICISNGKELLRKRANLFQSMSKNCKEKNVCAYLFLFDLFDLFELILILNLMERMEETKRTEMILKNSKLCCSVFT